MHHSKTEKDPDSLIRRYQRAKERRGNWESHWAECYEYALPQREGAISGSSPGEKKGARLYDGTATDAVDQLSASLLSELTPPWARWFDFKPGKALPEDAHADVSEVLERGASVLQGNFDRSNFAVEMHQCYLDLVTAGTACLMFEEAPIGEPSAFRFTAIPLADVVFEESISGRLDATFRRAEMTYAQFRDRFPDASLDKTQDEAEIEDLKIIVIEAVFPVERGYEYLAVREAGVSNGNNEAAILKTGLFQSSPFINFRWVKAPGEIYGRSPVMKALPDIKTANKVVELILKNASIAVTGIWQADDDGVLNPATIKLEPGTIIPKAVGSAGLTPLKPANDMNLSMTVLDQMRTRIRHALMVDMLGQPDTPNMTATEVVARSLDMARLLGATYGRLQSELLTPLAMRAVAILQRRGEVARFEIDGHMVELEYTSPLARQQVQREASMVKEWMAAITSLGAEAQNLIDPVKASRYLARAYGVPEDILRSEEDVQKALPKASVIPGTEADEDSGDLLQNIIGAVSQTMAGQGAVDPAMPASIESQVQLIPQSLNEENLDV